VIEAGQGGTPRLSTGALISQYPAGRFANVIATGCSFNGNAETCGQPDKSKGYRRSESRPRQLRSPQLVRVTVQRREVLNDFRRSMRRARAARQDVHQAFSKRSESSCAWAMRMQWLGCTLCISHL
jgi:hypothetical protein